MVYPIGKLIIFPIYKLWLRRVDGIENVPRDRAFIMAVNHSSYYDSILIHSIIIPKIDKKIHALVNGIYWNYALPRYFLNLGECIPVYVGSNKNQKQNRNAMKKLLDYLKKGDIAMVFPEGTRSPDGKLQKAYTGIAKLALESKVSVLPCGIIGSNKVIPKGKILPGFARCDVKIGKPMTFENKKYNQKSFEEITRKIMKEIAKLIGQKYDH
ncbi:1-acyl-sn-glycerol-3-phosphate acyltransferase [Candidatus Woesearchaeota archaeon]|nr:1-acyl-sn-glycerol-3-phosphate acyltransferase [Candidatus Woesearchaeota archaeon]